MMAKCLSLGGLAKPVHSFQGMAKGLEGLRKDRRVASSQRTDICMQGGMREFSPNGSKVVEVSASQI